MPSPERLFAHRKDVIIPHPPFFIRYVCALIKHAYYIFCTAAMASQAD